MKPYSVLFTALCLVCLPMTAHAEETAPAQSTTHSAANDLVHRIVTMWMVACEVPGMNEAAPEIRFSLLPDGRLAEEPVWANRRDDPVWQAAADSAIVAIKKAQPYNNLPEGLYNRPLKINFDARKACQGR